MDWNAWAQQRVQYSRARRGRYERGAQLGECALVEAMAFALGRQARRHEALAVTPGSATAAFALEGRTGPAAA